MEKYADHHKISLFDLKLERDILLVFYGFILVHIVVIYNIWNKKNISVIRNSNNVMKKVDISCIFYTIKTAWGQIDLKQHLCVKYVYRTLKTYHHVNFVFTQLSPLNRGVKSTEMLYSSKSTITLMKFYLSTSKITHLKI